MLADRDRNKYQVEARALLAKGSWPAGDVDYAIRLHDLLETPDGDPDPVARQLRTRLTGELAPLLTSSDNPSYRLRYGIFYSSRLDSPDPLERRLFALLYRGLTSYVDFQNGAYGQVDAAIEAYVQLDRVVLAAGPRAIAALKESYQPSLLGMATACYVRYDSRRELLHGGELRADLERQIRADLRRAILASERALEASDTPFARANALAALGYGYRLRYEDDEGYGDQETIDTAISLLREAVQMVEALKSEAGDAWAVLVDLRSIRDRLAGALTARDTVPDLDEAIALYLGNSADAASSGPAWTAGEAMSLMTAYNMRWMHTQAPADQERAREAYAAAFAAGETAHLPTAFDAAAQWGGLAWQAGWWADAGAAYQRATRVLHLMVRQQGSRAEREWIVRTAPGVVATRAALGLARSARPGALDDALVALETGRAVLLSEMFDRRAVDYQRVAALAGHVAADDYQRLTSELTSLEARLLLAGQDGDPADAAAVEQARRRRSALRARMPDAARNALAELEDPPAIGDLRRAAGPATVVHLAATGEGGLALILRPDGAPVEFVDLEELTVAAAVELLAGLEYAVQKPDIAVCDEVCEHLWSLVMERLLLSLAGTPEVVLIPGGVLAGLPWHAAKLPGRSAGHLLDHLAVSYMPNVRSLPLAREAWRSMPPSPRVLAVEAPEPTSAQPLRTTDEIAAVQACHDAGFRVIWLPGTEATRPRLREALSQFEVIHFAGHARADADPLAGGLLLAEDEFLTVRELLAGGIGAARFAVLSACETARVEDLVSDEMIGLPTALVQCGFGGVVGSLWAASDRLTPPLMKAFYREWRGNGAAPRQALRAAQQWARDRRRVPALAWANFVYVGP